MKSKRLQARIRPFRSSNDEIGTLKRVDYSRVQYRYDSFANSNRNRFLANKSPVDDSPLDSFDTRKRELNTVGGIPCSVEILHLEHNSIMLYIGVLRGG